MTGGGRVGGGDVDLDRRRARPIPPPWSPELAGVVATVPTYVTLPGVVRWSGRVIVTGSPTLTSACCAASSSIVTCRATDVTVSTGPGCTVAPSVGVTLVTRTGPGSNATDPSNSSPVRSPPRADWNAPIAAASQT